jgi:hypothetical protein
VVSAWKVDVTTQRQPRATAPGQARAGFLKWWEAHRKAGNGVTSIVFLTDPLGTYIELTEGLAP